MEGTPIITLNTKNPGTTAKKIVDSFNLETHVWPIGLGYLTTTSSHTHGSCGLIVLMLLYYYNVMYRTKPGVN